MNVCVCIFLLFLFDIHSFFDFVSVFVAMSFLLRCSMSSVDIFYSEKICFSLLMFGSAVFCLSVIYALMSDSFCLFICSFLFLVFPHALLAFLHAVPPLKLVSRPLIFRIPLPPKSPQKEKRGHLIADNT